MADELKNEFGPLLVILWRIGPAGKNRALREVVAVRLWMSGKRLGMNPISTKGLIPAAWKVSKMRSRIVQLYTGLPAASSV